MDGAEDAVAVQAQLTLILQGMVMANLGAELCSRGPAVWEIHEQVTREGNQVAFAYLLNIDSFNE